jgi:mannose-6-phosphate isomerase-like protein (cupin superfamily)
MQKKSFNTPDETMTPPKTKVEVIKIGDATLVRNTYEAGWKWSEHIKSIAGTDSCQVHHVLCILSGHLHVVLDNGDELEVEKGDVADIPPGHDAWVVGDDPVVAIDVGAAVYQKTS